MLNAHPMFRLLLAHPEVLAEHACAYGELLRDELQATGTAWQRRVQLQALAGGALLAGVMLLGQAVMFWVLMPEHPSVAQTVGLFAVPALPLLVGAWAGLATRRPATATAEAWAGLRRQVSADLAMIREAASPR